ncbi:MAG: sugar ABC transporter ATP-binding protein, partial [Mycobacteriales bacterium]
MSAGQPSDGRVLELKGLSKSFPGVVALDDVDLHVCPGEVVGLIGENGAGKSTVLKILAGLYQPDKGTIVLRGKPARFRNVAAATRAGIGMVFQEQSLVPNITVAENVLLGNEGQSVRGGVYRWRDLNERAATHLAKVSCTASPSAVTESLSFAERQMVEIAKVLSIEERTSEPPVILLDEPTSVLEQTEIDLLFTQIRRLREYASIVYVSHRMDEVLAVSDRVYVMRDGKVVAERVAADVDIAELHHLMVGRHLSTGYYKEDEQQAPAEKVRLKVTGLSIPGRFSDVSFSVRAGEVLGIAGVQHSGRESVCRTLFGAEPRHTGSIEIDGQRTALGSPVAAVNAGVGYVPSERRIEGVVLGLGVGRNISMAHPDQVAIGPFVDPRREMGLAKDWIAKLRIKTPGPRFPVGNLSGGNQQKVALAKWLISDRLRLLVLDHPTRGLDVGAKSDVYA